MSKHQGTAWRMRIVRAYARIKTAKELATFLGQKRNNITHIMRGDGPLTPKVAFAIKERLGPSLDWLWFGETAGLPERVRRELVRIEAELE